MKAVTSFLVSAVLLSACARAGATPAAFPLPPTVSGTATPPSSNSTRTTPGVGIPSSPISKTSSASAFPSPDAYQWVPVASGLSEPTDIQCPDDGSGRMFVLEQAGRIRIIQNGQVLSTPFLDISSKVASMGSEQGLLGLAFHPKFRQNPYVYVNYTDANGSVIIARFTANGNQADPSSEKILVRIDKPFANHNGGAAAFGPDGYLYLGIGDGGSEGDPLGNGQNTNVLLGKILRIDVDHGDLFSIPADNPFAHGGGQPEIWAYGLRNPWRIAFDRPTGDLYIADVGQDLWEEVDFVPAGSPGGANFGWNYREGMHPYSHANPPVGLKLIDPVAEYSHAEGGCAIVGGYVYRGRMPEWQGIYLYGDFCSGLIWGLTRSGGSGANATWSSELLFHTRAHITTFGEDQSGEVYFADRGGTIYELQK
ncbi:MAG TPA: PQQ-dependent sugar dehydrogenase [Anaerolineales bacterium]